MISMSQDDNLLTELQKTIADLENELKKKNDEVNYLNREVNSLKDMLRNESYKDDLTGLYNKIAIESILHYKKNRADRSKKPFTILLIDIDRINQINEQHGVFAGDMVLTDFADNLMKLLRSEDAIARWSDDKFISVLSDCYYFDAEVVAKKIKFFVKEWEVKLDNTILDYWVNIGISQYNMNETLEDMLERAEVNLKSEKDKANLFRG